MENVGECCQNLFALCIDSLKQINVFIRRKAELLRRRNNDQR